MEEKLYLVPVICEYMGYYRILAKSPEEAIEKAKVKCESPDEPLPTNMAPLEETACVDMDGGPLEAQNKG